MKSKKPADKLVAEYFKRCFLSVDGLWFVKLEEVFSFDTALDIDVAVWKVLPKIQARTIKKLLCLGDGIENLRTACDFKLSAESYSYELLPLDAGGFQINIHDCPWVKHISKAGREHLLDRIADAVCPVEHETFAREFGSDIAFQHLQKGCRKQQHCVFLFQKTGFRSQEKEANETSLLTPCLLTYGSLLKIYTPRQSR